MVEIRRRQGNNTRNPFGSSNGFNGRSSSSSSFSIGFVIKVIVVAFVAISGVRMLMGRRSGIQDKQTLDHPKAEPEGFGARLDASKQHVRRPLPSIPLKNPAVVTMKDDDPPKEPPVKPLPPPVNAIDIDEPDDEKDDLDPQQPLPGHAHDEDRHDEDGHDSGGDPEVPEKIHDAEDDKNQHEQHQSPDVKDGSSSVGNALNPIVVEKKGTGSTNVGYVKDFVHERKNPTHRTQKVKVKDMAQEVARLVKEASVTPCETLEGDGSSTTITVNPKCLDSDTPIIAYNPESFPRTWCGQEIAPGSAVTLTEHCDDSTVHLFSHEVPPVSGEHMPPIIIKSKREVKAEDLSLEAIECNIPCQREKDVQEGFAEWYIDGEESWWITQTMLDGYYDRRAKIERTDFMKDHYFSTQSFKSDVPLTYFDFDQHSLRNRPAIDFDSAKPVAAYLVDSNCAGSATKRNKYYGAMKAAISIDSYGSCGHNKDLPDGMSLDKLDDRVAIMKQYRIVLAFDEASSKDHISSVIWEALISGSLPVVVGSDNIREHLPPKSYINKADFSTWDDLAEYVKKVMDDKELWDSYHAWRDDDESVAAVEAKYAFTKTGATCRLCRWAYAKKYGLGWDQLQQQVRELIRVPRDKFCTTADHGLVSRPFSEKWVSKDGSTETLLKEDSVGESCSLLTTSGDIDVGAFRSQRKIVQHDGVTDFIISEIQNESPDSDAVLRLEFPGIRNPDGAYFANTHTTVPTIKGPTVSSATIQDDLVKITVLADWETSITCSGEGALEIVVRADKREGSRARRVRVIIEEMSAVHDKLTEFYSSSFFRRMTKDFVDPLPIYFPNP